MTSPLIDPKVAFLLLLPSLGACDSPSMQEAAKAPDREDRPAAATERPSTDVAATKVLPNPLAPLLDLVRERRGSVDAETRADLVSAFDRAVSRAIMAAEVDDLPHAGADRAGTRVIQHVKDATLGDVRGALIIADGTVRLDRAEDTLVVATDAAYVRECRGCTVIAGRLVVANDVKPGDKSPLSLIWSGGELDVDDAAGAVLAGPMAESVAARLGVRAADAKRMGPTPLSPSPGSLGVRVVEIEAVEGQPTMVTLATGDDGRRQRLAVGRAASLGTDGEPWRVVQGFGLHVALRRGDDVALLKVDADPQR